MRASSFLRPSNVVPNRIAFKRHLSRLPKALSPDEEADNPPIGVDTPVSKRRAGRPCKDISDEVPQSQTPLKTKRPRLDTKQKPGRPRKNRELPALEDEIVDDLEAIIHQVPLSSGNSKLKKDLNTLPRPGKGRPKMLKELADNWMPSIRRNEPRFQWTMMDKDFLASKSPTAASVFSKETWPVKMNKVTILAEKQCEDILKRFDFSDYKGCQIVDLNPGLGLWSAALNKAVNPSKHILLEPEKAILPYLQRSCTHPSFDQRSMDAYNWDTYDTLIADGTLTPETTTALPNKTLLITGVFTHEIKGHRLMAQIVDAIGRRDWLYKYGLIRMLLWVDNDMLGRYLPLTFGRRNRAAILIETYTHTKALAGELRRPLLREIDFLARVKNIRDEGIEKKTPAQIAKLTDMGVLDHENLMFFQQLTHPPMVRMNSNDFWPPAIQGESNSLTLLDIQPKAMQGYLGGEEPDTEPWIYFNFMIAKLLMARMVTVKEALKSVGPALETILDSDDDLKTRPELRDKIVNRLTPEELGLLARAYDRWPFRPVRVNVNDDVRLREDPFPYSD